MLFSVSVLASGDREMTREEIVELADAVAGHSGVASGIGTMSYGARLIVDAEDRATAARAGQAVFVAAAARAGLPDWPIGHLQVLAEGEDDDTEDVLPDDLDESGLDDDQLEAMAQPAALGDDRFRGVGGGRGAAS